MDGLDPPLAPNRSASSGSESEDDSIIRLVCLRVVVLVTPLVLARVVRDGWG